MFIRCKEIDSQVYLSTDRSTVVFTTAKQALDLARIG